MSDSTPRPSPAPFIFKVLGGLVAFVLAAASVGVLSAALAVPAVKATGEVTDEAVSFFDALPTALEEKELSQQSRMWAADGSLLATFYFRNRVIVDLDEINTDMQDAMVAIEDSRFYEHGGVDLQGVARAAVNNFTEDGLQGASTLTQQYVKNVLISQADAEGDMRALNAARERSYGRKLREMKLAIALEQRLSKEEILERYLNIAQFGRSQYGVEAAARYYFNTTAADLTLAEAATLAGVTQSPNALDPEKHPDKANAKRNTVLARMHELGYISQEQLDEARSETVEETLDVRPTSQTCVGVGKKGNAAFFSNWMRRVPKQLKKRWTCAPPARRVSVLARKAMRLSSVTTSQKSLRTMRPLVKRAKIAPNCCTAADSTFTPLWIRSCRSRRKRQRWMPYRKMISPA